MAKRLRGFAEQVEYRENEDEIEGLLGREGEEIRGLDEGLALGLVYWKEKNGGVWMV